MPIYFTPKQGVKIEGRNDAPQKFEWHIRGSNDYGEVMINFASYLDPVFNFNKYLRDFKITQLAVGLWLGEAEYKLPTPSDPEFRELDTYRVPYQYEIGGIAQKLTHSLSTIASYKATGVTGNPPDHKGAVNVTRDKVEGYEIEFPTFTWTEKHMLHQDVLTPAYRRAVANIYGKTNHAAFRGFPLNCVRFLGMTGGTSEKYFDYHELTFKFASSEDIEDFDIGEVHVDRKGAWELLWVEYDHSKDTGSGRTILVPKYVHIEQIFDEEDFSDLQIGIEG